MIKIHKLLRGNFLMRRESQVQRSEKGLLAFGIITHWLNYLNVEIQLLIIVIDGLSDTSNIKRYTESFIGYKAFLQKI